MLLEYNHYIDHIPSDTKSLHKRSHIYIYICIYIPSKTWTPTLLLTCYNDPAYTEPYIHMWTNVNPKIVINMLQWARFWCSSVCLNVLGQGHKALRKWVNTHIWQMIRVKIIVMTIIRIQNWTDLWTSFLATTVVGWSLALVVPSCVIKYHLPQQLAPLLP